MDLAMDQKCLMWWTSICLKGGKEKMISLEFGQRYAFGKDLTHAYETTYAYEPLILKSWTNE